MPSLSCGITLTSASITKSSSLTLNFLLLSYKDACNYIDQSAGCSSLGHKNTQVHDLKSPGKPCHPKILNWITSAQSLLPCKVTYIYKYQEHRHIWWGAFCLHRLPRWLPMHPVCQYRRLKRHGFDSWVRKVPWRRAWQPTPVFLPGESHGQRSLVSYSS